MLVDQTTLSDLEIFGDVAGRGGVLALLDDDETESGRRALRRRLGKPFSEVSSIQDTQKAVKFFILEPKRRFVQRASGIPHRAEHGRQDHVFENGGPRASSGADRHGSPGASVEIHAGGGAADQLEPVGQLASRVEFISL
jgi:hypothetical protein